ncbi:Uncharacterised protein [Sphingobacterium spiritivorum]|uniref:Uncharacterized protein n=1 Tax=Sphingobacterium spiritivorum TaxID=258 RepID=A0A380B970_SPHSI|nr:Uncharacterised protein [Sphingobacterium spiritivorum]
MGKGADGNNYQHIRPHSGLYLLVPLRNYRLVNPNLVKPKSTTILTYPETYSKQAETRRAKQKKYR